MCGIVGYVGTQQALDVVLEGLRRLRVRSDRLGVIIDAWTTLAASVICFRIFHHDAM